MDIIVRTAHGTADVAVTVHDETATLADLISIVSARAAPSTVLVDGRPVDTDRPVRSSGVIAGSVIDTDVEREPAGRVSRARLAQLTGAGAGTIRPLAVGTYRIGPGVRVNVAELAVGRVERPAFEVTVAADATTIRPIPLTHHLVTHGGEPLTADVEWTSGYVTSGGRTFAHERGYPTGAGAGPAMRRADGRGRVPYERPSEPPGGTRLAMIDARRDAEQLRDGLWAHRPDVAAPCQVGLDAATEEPIDVDLVAERVVVLTGEVAVTAAHARAMLIDVVTRYGPADVDVAVAAETEDLHHWDWMKWLPHARDRQGEDIGPPRLFDGHGTGDLPTFVARCSSGRRPQPGGRRTVLVVAGDALWSTPRAPLHQLVVGPPPDISIIVLTDRVRHAPANWTTLIEHRDAAPGQAVLTRHPAAGAPRRMLAPLPGPATAADIARHLTALVDQELPTTSRVDTPSVHTLGELVCGGQPATGKALRWHRRVGTATPAEMPIGLDGAAPIVVDLGFDRGVVVSGSSLDDAADIVRTLLASMAAAWSPRELAVVSVDHRAAPRLDPIRALPHDAGTFSERGARAGRHLTARLATELLATEPRARRIAVVVYGPAHTEAAAPGFVNGLTRLAAAVDGIHVIIATDQPIAALDPALAAVCPVRITVDRVGGRRRATLQEGRLHTPFTPFEPAITGAGAVEVTPLVFGRALTALERHVGRNGTGVDDAARSDREFQRLVDELNAVAHAAALRPLPTLVPTPLPARVSADALLPIDAGDGIPLGLAARPDGTATVPLRWRPDSSLVVVGSATSGVDALLDVLVVGLTERHRDHPLYVIDADTDRRAALTGLAERHGVVSPDDVDAIGALLDHLVTHQRPPEAPTPVLVVRDLGDLAPLHRRRLRDLIIESTVHAVAAAFAADAAADLLGAPVRLVVGELDDPSGYAPLGVADASDIVGRHGRCLLGQEQLLLQIAELGEGLASALAAAPHEPPPARPAAVSAGLAPPTAGRT